MTNQNNKEKKETAKPITRRQYRRQKLREYKKIKLEELSPAEQAKWKHRRRYARRHKTLNFLMAFFILVMSCYLGVGVFAVKTMNKMLEGTPQLRSKDFISEESSKIYDGDGKLLTEIGTIYRENTTYDKCPESLIDAFLSIEDSRYFQHNGFDIPRFTKAAIENVMHGDFGQGGSTFTMQLVKNTYFSIDAGDESTERSKSLSYKAQQIFLALKLERMMDKKHIFELYVNKLNFGGQIRGVKKAAQYYFNKDITELNISESALLAGIVNLPNQYNPYDYLEYATRRRNQVLDMMEQHGYITAEEKELAKSIKIEDQLIGEENLNVESRDYPAYIDAVIEEAIAMTGYDPVVKGMRIYTSMNRTIQSKIESIEAGDGGVYWPDDLFQAAIVVMNNHNGEIVGIGGGRHYDQNSARSLNRATSQFKQPGSSIKPVLSYALAFEYLGYSLDEILLDKPITFPGESRVLVNATGKYVGDVTIKNAVAQSLNIPAILTLENVTAKIGSEKVVSYLNDIGYSAISNEKFHMSYAIGGNDFVATVKQMAGAHAMLINMGVYNEPHTITKIVMSTGEEYLPENQNKRVLSSGSAWLVTQLEENNVSGNIFNYMQILRKSYPVYAKTGTTDWGSDGLQYGIPKNAAKDKWMISNTSQYTNAVWTGYDKAVKNQGTYFQQWKSNMNIPGNINLQLLNAEEEVAEKDALKGVSKPDDVVEVTYAYGTYPHVKSESWMPRGSMKTSQVSSAGLKNTPMISADEYTSGAPTLTSINASCSNGLVYINWNSQNGCSGGSRDISLHDQWNNISQKGACLVDTSWLFRNRGNTYVAEIYANSSYITTVTSTTGAYAGLPAELSGNISVCGYYYNSKGTSDKLCTNAGTYIPEVEEEEEEEEEDEEKKDDEKKDDEKKDEKKDKDKNKDKDKKDN